MKSLSSLHSTANGVLAADFASGDLQTQVGVDVDHQLDLAAGLDALDGKLGNGLLSLPDDLTDLFLLILVRVEVGVVLIFFSLGLLLLGLRLRLGDLDLADTLANANENVATSLGGVVLSDTTSGEGGLSVQERLELDGLTGGELDTNGVLQVRSGSDHGVDRLLNVLLLELLDKRGLDGGTPGGQLRGVDGASEGRRGKDLSLLGEDVAGQLGDLGSVRGTTSEDNLNLSQNLSLILPWILKKKKKSQGTNLVNVQDIQTSLLDNLLDQAGELGEGLAGEKFVASTVDSGAEINAICETLNAQAGVGTQAQGLASSLTLKLQLGETTSVLARIGLVLLNELLGEMVDDDLVQRSSTQLVVMSSCEDTVHATTASENSSVGSGTTEVGDDNKLVSNSSLGPGIVSQGSGNRLMDELEDLKASSLSGGGQSLALSIGEVSGDSDDGGIDFLAQVVRGGLLQTTEMAGGNLGDGDSAGGLVGRVHNGESNGRLVRLRMRRVMAWCGVYRLEAVGYSCQRLSHMKQHFYTRKTYSLPR